MLQFYIFLQVSERIFTYAPSEKNHRHLIRDKPPWCKRLCCSRRAGGELRLQGWRKYIWNTLISLNGKHHKGHFRAIKIQRQILQTFNLRLYNSIHLGLFPLLCTEQFRFEPQKKNLFKWYSVSMCENKNNCLPISIQNRTLCSKCAVNMSPMAGAWEKPVKTHTRAYARALMLCDLNKTQRKHPHRLTASKLSW